MRLFRRLRRGHGPAHGSRPRRRSDRGTDAPSDCPLVLIETFADIGGGHWTTALPRLARAARDEGRACSVICLNGIYPDTRDAVIAEGARVIDRADPRSVPGALMRAAEEVLELQERLAVSRPALAASLGLPDLARGLVEAASLRWARRRTSARATTVVMTANQTLHAFTAAIGGLPHARVVHETDRPEGRLARTLDRLCARGLRRTRFVCTTPEVARKVTARVPGAQTHVVPFAARQPSLYLSDADRRRARAELGIDATVTASLVGGWWASKDVSTVLGALEHVDRPLTVLIAGHPINHEMLAAHPSGADVTIRVIDRVLSPAELTGVYGASDFTIVSRIADGCESGTVYDAVQRGTPLLCSTHDPALTEQLTSRSWARLFQAHDSSDLAQAIIETCDGGLARPPRDVAGQLFGLLDAGQQLAELDREVAAVRR